MLKNIKSKIKCCQRICCLSIKKVSHILLSLVLILLLVSCSETSNDIIQIGVASEKQSTNAVKESEVVSAFKSAGYSITSVDSNIDRSGMPYKDMITNYNCYKINRQAKAAESSIAENGKLMYTAYPNEEVAVSVYEELTSRNLGLDKYKKRSGKGYSIGIRTDDFSGHTEIILRVYDAIIYMGIDWTEFRNSGTYYDNCAQKVIESLIY